MPFKDVETAPSEDGWTPQRSAAFGADYLGAILDALPALRAKREAEVTTPKPRAPLARCCVLLLRTVWSERRGACGTGVQHTGKARQLGRQSQGAADPGRGGAR